MSEQKKAEKSKKNFHEADQFVQDLERACTNLTYISETDASVDPIKLSKPASTSLADYAATLQIKNTPIKEVNFREFFDRLSAEKDWYQDFEKRRAKKFSELRDLLNEQLENIRVIRAGKIRVDIYVVGIDPQGKLAGVRTKAVET